MNIDICMRPFFYVIQHRESALYYAGFKADRADSSNLLTEGGYQTSSKLVRELIAKDGLDSFVIRKIKHFNSQKEAHDYEIRFLKRVKAKNNPSFLNQTSGATDFGMLGKKFTKEHRAKISESNKGKSHSLETKQKISNKLKGKGSYQRTEETRRKQSEARKGIVFSDEHKKKLSEAQQKVTRPACSNETKEKISKKNKGRTFSDEWKQNMSLAQQRRYATSS